tara:strand:+ start:222 stop:773 length:552 start_codon:yes stop_codon:yes gene_type:complete
MAFISVDASTNSMAFAIFTDTLSAWGKIIYNHDSKSIYDKAGTIGKKSGSTVSALIERFEARTMIIEKPIFANSPMTASNLALTQGALVGASFMGGIHRIVGTEPITWQSYIGNKNLTKAEKEQIKLDNPNQSVNWLKVRQRELRKQRTMDYVNNRFSLDITDNDVGDAIGIACYAFDSGVLK